VNTAPPPPPRAGPLTASAELSADEAGGVPPVLFLSAVSCLNLANSAIASGSNCETAAHRTAKKSRVSTFNASQCAHFENPPDMAVCVYAE
jgi:hypothetical protein